METFKSIIATAVLALTTTLATANVDPKPTKDEVKQELTDLLGAPNFRIGENDLTATVHFLINNSNEIVVLDVKAENELIESYIKSRLNYKEVKSGKLVKGQDYKVSVRVQGDRW